jgi:hypothetical protein
MKKENVQGLRPVDLHGPIPRSWYPAPPSMRVGEDIPPPPLDCFAHGPVEAPDGKLVFVVPSCIDGWLLCVRAPRLDALEKPCTCGDPDCDSGYDPQTIGVIAARHEIGARRGRELAVPYDYAWYWPNSQARDEDGIPSAYLNDALEPASRAFSAWASVRFQGALPPQASLAGCTDFYVGGEEVYAGDGPSPDDMQQIRRGLAAWMRMRKMGWRSCDRIAWLIDPRRRARS